MFHLVDILCVSVCARSATVNNRFSVQVFMIVFIIMKGHQSVNQNIHSFKKRSAEEIFIEINKCHNLMPCALITCAQTKALKWSVVRECGIVFRCHIYGEIRLFLSLINSPKANLYLFFRCAGFLVSFLFIGKHLRERKKCVVKIYTKETSVWFLHS